MAFKRRKARLFWPGSNGWTTEGTLGRCKSTVANRARSSDGGGVLIKFIKLAAVPKAYSVPKNEFRVLSSGFRVWGKRKSPFY